MTQQEYEAYKSGCVNDFCEEHGYIRNRDLTYYNHIANASKMIQ